MDDKALNEANTEAQTESNKTDAPSAAPVEVVDKVVDDNAAEVERAKTEGPADPPAETLAPADTTTGGPQDQTSDVKADPAPISNEGETAPPADPVESLRADMEAVQGRMDLLEQEMRERMETIGRDVDGAIRRYMAQVTGDGEGKTFGERLVALERKLKHS